MGSSNTIYTKVLALYFIILLQPKILFFFFFLNENLTSEV